MGALGSQGINAELQQGGHKAPPLQKTPFYVVRSIIITALPGDTTMKLTELIDIDELRELCESFTAQTNAVMAFLDLDGNILIATGWKDICTHFHRQHPVASQRCRESDTELAGQLRKGEKYTVYKCKNGLVDVAVPILIEGKHVANFFTGQFLFEAPDKEYFIKQAEEFGFDKDSYFEALDSVPVFSEERIRSLMEFFTRLVQLVAKMGLVQKRQHENNILLEQEIAERQRAQEELSLKQQQLEELNNTLEQRIEAAVKELRIKDQLMILQNRQAAMGEMINNIAHQWKQPLNNLGIILQTMSLEYSDGVLAPAQLEADHKQCFEIIKFMSQTIDDFMHFFRADKSAAVFGMRQAVTHTLNLLSASLHKNNIKVQVEPGEEIYVSGYPNEYAQVLLNLLGNARDVFIERKTADPAITVRVFIEAGQAVTTISDNGGGIPVEALHQVFNPYFTTKVPEKGTGIGLFMSKSIIEQNMAGSLTAENHANGACFRIELPWNG